MAMQLGRGDTGHLLIISDEPFPAPVKRVEYYREQKLFNLVFKDGDHPGNLSELELPDDIDTIVRHAPSDIVVLHMKDDETLESFEVPLIQVGV